MAEVTATTALGKLTDRRDLRELQSWDSGSEERNPKAQSPLVPN